MLLIEDVELWNGIGRLAIFILLALAYGYALRFLMQKLSVATRGKRFTYRWGKIWIRSLDDFSDAAFSGVVFMGGFLLGGITLALLVRAGIFGIE